MKTNNEFKIRSVSFLLVLVLIASAMTITIEAVSTNPLTEEDAGDIIYKAFDFYNRTQCLNWPSYAPDTKRMEIPKRNNNHISYVTVNEDTLPGGSYEAMKKVAKDIYVDEIAPSIYAYERTFTDPGQEPLPMFMIGEDKRLYIYKIGETGSSLYFGYGMYTWPWEGFGKDDVPAFQLVDSNSNEATVYVKINYGGEVEGKWYWIECRMVNTANGWRIAESPFATMMARGETAIELWEDGLIPYDESPSTGDVSGEKVAVIGAVSLACIIPAACLMRRRRRRVAVD